MRVPIRDVLAQQTSIKTQQSELCQKVLKLGEEALKLKSINSSSSNASPPVKKKIRVTRDLTVSNFMLQQLSMLVSVIHILVFPLQNKVSVIHENINEGFRVDERSVPENNACIIHNGLSSQFHNSSQYAREE